MLLAWTAWPVIADTWLRAHAVGSIAPDTAYVDSCVDCDPDVDFEDVMVSRFTLLQMQMQHPKKDKKTNRDEQANHTAGGSSSWASVANSTFEPSITNLTSAALPSTTESKPSRVRTNVSGNGDVYSWLLQAERQLAPIAANTSMAWLPLLQRVASIAKARVSTESGRTGMTDPTLIIGAAVVIMSVSFAFWCTCLLCGPFSGSVWDVVPAFKPPSSYPDEPEAGAPVVGKWNVGVQSTPGQCRWFAFNDESRAYEFYNHTYGFVPRILFDSSGNEIACATFNHLALNNIRRQSRIPCIGVQPGKWMVVVRHCTARKNLVYAFDDEWAAEHFLNSFNSTPGLLLSPEGEEIRKKGHNPIALRALRNTYRGAEEERNRRAPCC